MERRSTNAEAKKIMVELMSERVQTIAFTRARVVAELLYRYTREELQRRPSQPARARPGLPRRLLAGGAPGDRAATL